MSFKRKSALSNLMLIGAVLFSPLTGQADIDCIIVKLSDGRNCRVNLVDTPSITFSGNNVAIGTEILSLDDIVSYTFADSSSSSLTDIADNDSGIVFSGSKVHIPARYKNQSVNIVDMKGATIPLEVSYDSSDDMIIDLDELAPNVYILSIGTASYKLIKR